MNKVGAFISTTRNGIFYEADGAAYNIKNVVRALADGAYLYAGTIEVASNHALEALEEAFEKTQTIEHPWREGGPTRNAAKGDVFCVFGEFYVVAEVGFDKLDFGAIFTDLLADQIRAAEDAY